MSSFTGLEVLNRSAAFLRILRWGRVSTTDRTVWKSRFSRADTGNEIDGRMPRIRTLMADWASKIEPIHKSTTQKEEYLSPLNCGEIIERRRGFLVDSFLPPSTLTEAIEGVRPVRFSIFDAVS